MTEESYQQGRKFMQSCNYVRSQIVKAKGEVSKWTRMEMAHRQNLQHGQADGAKKCLDKAIIKLKSVKDRFEQMSFPDSNIVKIDLQREQCEGCGELVKKGTLFCNQCIGK